MTLILPQSEYEALINYQGEFDVVCYQVVYESARVLNNKLSPLLETEKQAREILEQVKEKYPNARVSQQTYFHSTEDDDAREYILSKIVKAGRVAQTLQA